MDYRCELVEQAETPTLVVHTRSSVDRLPSVLGPAWVAVAAAAGKAGAAPSGPPFVAYHNTDLRDLDIEIGMPFEATLEGDGEVTPGRISASTAVETLHVGPFDRIAEAYDALQAWMDVHGYAPAGPAYEQYLDDPHTTDVAELRTKIVWPVRSTV